MRKLLGTLCSVLVAPRLCSERGRRRLMSPADHAGSRIVGAAGQADARGSRGRRGQRGSVAVAGPAAAGRPAEARAGLRGSAQPASGQLEPTSSPGRDHRASRDVNHGRNAKSQRNRNSDRNVDRNRTSIAT